MAGFKFDSIDAARNGVCVSLDGVESDIPDGTICADLFDERVTSPAINISYNNKVSYVLLWPGKVSHTINLNYNGNIYRLE